MVASRSCYDFDFATLTRAPSYLLSSVALIKSQYQGHLTNSDSYLAGRRKQNDASMNDKQWMSKRTNASSSEKLQQPRPRSWQ